LSSVTTKHKDTSYSSPNYAYDFNGNITIDKSKRMDIVYDWRDMPLTFALRSDSANWAQVKMLYDASGNRVLKIEKKKIGSDTVAKAVAYVDGELEYESPNMDSSDFKLKVAYYSGEGGAEARVTFDTATGLYNNYFVKDHLGSTRVLLEEGGHIDKINAYYAYGARKDLNNSTNAFKLRKEFTGKEFDDEGASSSGKDGMNLDYFGARYYDPEIGRWTTKDPKKQFSDLYAYAGNGFNPINGTDPNGNALVGGILAGSLAGTFTYARLHGHVSDNDLTYAIALSVAIAGILGAIDPTDLASAATLGGVSSGATEAVSQYFENGQNINNINWATVAISAGMGGASAGVLQRVMKGLFGEATRIPGTNRSFQSGGYLNSNAPIRDASSVIGGTAVEQGLHHLYNHTLGTDKGKNPDDSKKNQDGKGKEQQQAPTQQQEQPAPAPVPAPVQNSSPPDA
jgi:RHS repeat-associated protein